MSKAQKFINMVGWLFVVVMAVWILSSIKNDNVFKILGGVAIGMWITIIMMKVEGKKHE